MPCPLRYAPWRKAKQPLGGIVLAALLCALLQRPGVALAQSAPVLSVQWTAAQQASSGVHVQHLAAGVFHPVRDATASVLDPAPLLRMQAAVATASARLEAAQTRQTLAQLRARRDEGLYTHGQNVALAQVQQSQAAADAARADVMVAQATLRAARATLRANVGAALDTRLARDATLRRSIADGRDEVVDLTLPPGMRLGSAARVRLHTPDGGVLPLAIVGPAASASRALQGMRYVGIARATDALMPGLQLRADVTSGTAQHGVLVPSSAVVWSNGRALVFIAGEASASGARTFQARPTSTASPLPGGYLQPGWDAVDVVTQGAGLLLTPPPSPHAAPATGDGDDD